MRDRLIQQLIHLHWTDTATSRSTSSTFSLTAAAMLSGLISVRTECRRMALDLSSLIFCCEDINLRSRSFAQPPVPAAAATPTITRGRSFTTVAACPPDFHSASAVRASDSSMMTPPALRVVGIGEVAAPQQRNLQVERSGADRRGLTAGACPRRLWLTPPQ